MAKNSIGPLEKRLKAAGAQLEKEQGPQEVIFETYWGDEEVPDDGTPIFRTQWGGGPIDEDEGEL